ncbi:MAG: hypothetical protein KIC66_07665 [Clostridium sp.]|uniref:Lipoprotein n=1 Tax=Clostridium paraputrificum TaxID=29363 RepID=A0A6N3GLQ5_9CLOT|nr:hypothetical protein [Clostridium sp.]MBS5926949.1 hypothetical protein [Clostridium sp.]MBS5986171.1 hypothetical protein [Clostridium sp.]
MSKKIIALILGTMMTVSLVGCSNKDNKEDNTKTFAIASDEKYSNLDGEWSKDITLKTFDEKFDKLFGEIRDKSKTYGLTFNEKGEESVKQEKGRTVNKKYLYLDNENPEKNRLESLYFGRKLFGDDLSAGQITLKLSLNFDGEGTLSGENKFDFGDTSLASYAEFMTGEKDRDYSKINEEIIKILKSDSGEGVYQNTINGLYEEYTVNKEYLVYTLETKELQFVKEGSEENIDAATTTN